LPLQKEPGEVKGVGLEATQERKILRASKERVESEKKDRGRVSKYKARGNLTRNRHKKKKGKGGKEKKELKIDETHQDFREGSKNI